MARRTLPTAIARMLRRGRRIAKAIGAHVHMAHELTPAEHLPHEALTALDRGVHRGHVVHDARGPEAMEVEQR